MQRTGKETFEVFQESSRGGELALMTAGDRVMIGDEAVTVIEDMLQ
jgi:hypothetical protein